MPNTVEIGYNIPLDQVVSELTHFNVFTIICKLPLPRDRPSCQRPKPEEFSPRELIAIHWLFLGTEDTLPFPLDDSTLHIWNQANLVFKMAEQDLFTAFLHSLPPPPEKVDGEPYISFQALQNLYRTRAQKNYDHYLKKLREYLPTPPPKW